MTRFSFRHLTQRTLARSLRLSVVGLLSIMLGVLMPLFTPAAHAQTTTSSSTIIGWGNNESEAATVPAGLNDVTAIATGGFHNLVLKRDGTVVAWGDNTRGQSTVPAGLKDVTALAAGVSHSLALKKDGTVVAWGGNTSGQSTVPAGLKDVTAIAAGTGHSLALKRDGTVVAWGDNTSGQSTVPAGLKDVTAIAAGVYHSLALKRDGTVVAWGDNTSGQSTVPAGLKDVIAIAAGSFHNLALKKDGTVIALGSNPYAVVPAGLKDVTAIAAGTGHNLALKKDGTVVAWGDSHYGQLAVPSGLKNVTAISAKRFHSLVLQVDTIVLDTTPPETTITTQLATLVASRTASFSFTSSETNSTFSCSLDGAAFASCPAPQSYQNLADGSHTFQVRATDQAGNADASPASATWFVDTTAPETTFLAKPENPTSSTAAVVVVNGTDSGSGVARYECQLDTAGFGQCNSTMYGLRVGSHTIQARAIDKAGNVDPTPASYTWEIRDNTPPTTTIAAVTPNAPVSNNWFIVDTNVTVSAKDEATGIGVTETRCVIDPPMVPASFADLPTSCALTSAAAIISSEGVHEIYAASRDAANNIEPVQHLTVKIDKTAPTVAAVVSQANASASATVTLSASDAVSGVSGIYYTLDNSKTINTYTKPLVFDTVGTYQIISYSLDNAVRGSGNKTMTVTIATLAPQHSPTIDLTSAPVSVVENTWESDTLIRMFSERQNYTLPADVTVDAQGTVIPAGTKVNVFYIHADKTSNDNSSALKLSGSVTFDSKVLGVISNASMLTTTHAVLGSAITAYSSSADQGIEWGDSVTRTSDNQLDLTFSLWNMSDDVRVITLAE